MAGMHGTLANHLGVDAACFGRRVRRRLGVDPEAVDPEVSAIGALTGAVGIRAAGRIGAGDVGVVRDLRVGIVVSLQYDIFLRKLNIFAVGQLDVEIIKAAPIENEGAVSLLAKTALRELADKQGPLNSVLLPLACGRTEDVDDGVRRQRQDRAHGGVVAAENGQVELLVGAQGRSRHGHFWLKLLRIGKIWLEVRIVVGGLGDVIRVVVTGVVVVRSSGFPGRHCGRKRKDRGEREKGRGSRLSQ